MLVELTESLPFEAFVIDHLVDGRGRYRLDLDPQFPFAIKLYRFTPSTNQYPMNWHERLEIFVPLSGDGQFRMGDRAVDFAEDDVLVVDNLKLHGLGTFCGPDCRAMTITFNAEFVCNIASPLCDFAYLIPFQCQSGEISPVVRSGEPLAGPIHEALARLIGCYFDPSDRSDMRIGCKAYLLELLFHLSRHFAGAKIAHSEYVRQQERALRLGRLFDHLQEHYARPMSITQAARMVGMSDSRFMKVFKQATGTTFVSYLTQVRLAHAFRLLRQTDLAVGEIAERVGVADHAYFDRKFKQKFRTSPRAARSQGSARSEA